MFHRLLDDSFVLQLDLEGFFKYLLRDLVILSHSFELRIAVIGAFFLGEQAVFLLERQVLRFNLLVGILFLFELQLEHLIFFEQGKLRIKCLSKLLRLCANVHITLETLVG